ncbi:MAG: TPM domain-containing protein, partial [bacterium]|nr:TPM domain-containing protein [bacterium]
MKYLLALVLIALPLQVSALEVPEAPTDYVLDQADILSESYEAALKERLTTLEDETTAEIGVLTIESLDGYVLEWYGLDVLREWGIGQEGLDNGVLILISEGDREVRIEVGYGLEGAVTDANAKGIIIQKMTPLFKEGDYESGLTAGLDALIIEIENEAENFLTAEPAFTETDAFIADIVAIFVIVMFAFVGTTVGLGMLPKKKRKQWQKRPIVIGLGVLGFVLIGISSLLMWGLGIAALLGAQKIVSSMTITAPKKGSGGGTWGSGSSFGGGSGGGISGGFGGGSGGGG